MTKRYWVLGYEDCYPYADNALAAFETIEEAETFCAAMNVREVPRARYEPHLGFDSRARLVRAYGDDFDGGTHTIIVDYGPLLGLERDQ